MKISDIVESNVTYQKRPTRKFKVREKGSFEELKKNKELIQRSGPHTTIIDVTDEPEVKKSPFENKWNAMTRLYGYDENEIVCAFAGHDEWICLAINVEI